MINCRINSAEGAVTKVVQLRLLGGWSDIEGAARHLLMGVRTLQRRLADEGTCYRTILTRERYRRARALLQGGSQSITDISIALGYEHMEDFTRAFTKWHGYPPSAVRRPCNRPP